MRSELKNNSEPLCIDLDGTLLKTNTLFEQILILLRTEPWKILRLLIWLSRGGKVYFKAQLARTVHLNIASLPYRQEVLDYANNSKAVGRKLILASAANEHIAQQIAQHLGIFDEVFASDDITNLKSTVKAQLLTQKFGYRRFDYMGNSRADLPVWKASRKAIVVAGSKTVTMAVKRTVSQIEILSVVPNIARVKAWWKALRPYQWVKNLLVFLPLILAHDVADTSALLAAGFALITLSLTASTTYLINDLLDLESDRQHHWKKQRPLAAGNVSIPAGITTALVLLVVSFGLALWLLPTAFTALLAIYAVSTIAYSLRLKRVVILDVILLSSFYTLRVFLGTAATGIATSFWLLAFSIFFFLSLALVKRFAELTALPTSQEKTVNGREYIRSDRTSLAHLGTGSGYLSVLVLALYINSDEVRVFYERPELLWFICPLLLYWVSRLWFLAHRHRIHEDPILFAFHDKVSYVVGILTIAAAFLAT